MKLKSMCTRLELNKTIFRTFSNDWRLVVEIHVYGVWSQSIFCLEILIKIGICLLNRYCWLCCHVWLEEKCIVFNANEKTGNWQSNFIWQQCRSTGALAPKFHLATAPSRRMHARMYEWLEETENTQKWCKSLIVYFYQIDEENWMIFNICSPKQVDRFRRYKTFMQFENYIEPFIFIWTFDSENS